MGQREQMREQIVKEASAIFSHFGFRKTTMDDIARATNKGKSSLYYYFNSKEEVFEAVVEREIAHLRKRLRLAINSSEDPKEKLKNSVLNRMQAIQELENLSAALKSDYLQNFGFIKKIRRKYEINEIEMFKEVLEYGIRRNYFQIQDLDLASVAIVTALKGMEPQLMSSEDNKVEFEERLISIINVLFYGIVKR
ncbi:MAG: TetR/AcrR family transcriptional regulator [Okeania sp. SIO3C4]|nr:TetR/AcrR family transcriptional regulator [Okeania sp. SIO3C4]